MEEIKREMKDILEFNENEGAIHPNLWETTKTVLRGKLITLSTLINKSDRSYTSNLTAHLKALEQKGNNHIQEGKKAGNNQTQGWNQPNGNKQNDIKNQQNQKLILWENLQIDNPPSQAN